MISVRSTLAYTLKSSLQQGWLDGPTCQYELSQFWVLWSEIRQ